MAVERNSSSAGRRTRRPPAATPEIREQQLVSLAVDLAEKQILEGTASAQVITHFLKMGSGREQLEKQLLRETVELKKAQREQMAAAENIQALYTEALEAMRTYGGHEPARPVEEDDEY